MHLIKVLFKQWDRAAASVLTAVGAFFLISGWVGVSGTLNLAEQAPYIVSGGLGGLFLLGLGAVLWISADLQDEWRKLDRIEKALADGVLRWDPADGEAAVAPFPGTRRAKQGDGGTSGARNGTAAETPPRFVHAAASREHA
jgi:hypothetical protein